MDYETKTCVSSCFNANPDKYTDNAPLLYIGDVNYGQPLSTGVFDELYYYGCACADGYSQLYPYTNADCFDCTTIDPFCNSCALVDTVLTCT